MTEPRVKLIEIAKKLFFTYKSLSLYQTDYFELLGAIKEVEQLESQLSSLRQSAKGMAIALENLKELGFTNEAEDEALNRYSSDARKEGR